MNITPFKVEEMKQICFPAALYTSYSRFGTRLVLAGCKGNISDVDLLAAVGNMRSFGRMGDCGSVGVSVDGNYTALVSYNRKDGQDLKGKLLVYDNETLVSKRIKTKEDILHGKMRLIGGDLVIQSKKSGVVVLDADSGEKIASYPIGELFAFASQTFQTIYPFAFLTQKHIVIYDILCQKFHETQEPAIDLNRSTCLALYKNRLFIGMVPDKKGKSALWRIDLDWPEDLETAKSRFKKAQDLTFEGCGAVTLLQVVKNVLYVGQANGALTRLSTEGENIEIQTVQILDDSINHLVVDDGLVLAGHFTTADHGKYTLLDAGDLTRRQEICVPCFLRPSLENGILLTFSIMKVSVYAIS